MQVIANATHNQKILEVVRGAGATLGVVVQLKVQLYDVSSFHGFALTALDLSGSNLKYAAAARMHIALHCVNQILTAHVVLHLSSMLA